MEEPVVNYTERELDEIHLALIYARYFRHGTTGHNSYMVMAKMAIQIGFNLDEKDKLLRPLNVGLAPSEPRGSLYANPRF